jgi:hypothetical protein
MWRHAGRFWLTSLGGKREETEKNKGLGKRGEGGENKEK